MDTDCSLELRIGRPHVNHEDKNDTTIATFTRFVLPFAYKLGEQQTPPPSSSSFLHYTLNPLSDLSFLKRKKYFTRETGRILYEQAWWLDMCDSWNDTIWGKAEVEVTLLRDRTFKVGMLPPRITLFEAAGGQDGDIPARLAAELEADIRHTGFLQVDVYFQEEQEHTPELDDLLLFNEMFRYYDMPYDAHLGHFTKSFGKVPVSYSGTGPWPTIAELVEQGAAPQCCYFERWANLLTEIPLLHNNRKYRLFPKDWAEAGKDWTCGETRKTTSTHWQVYDENRAYVWTAAFLAKGGLTLKKRFQPGKQVVQAIDYSHWIKLLNVDLPFYQGITDFERNWAEQNTYTRWQESGTWYGFCYHGGAVLAPHDEFLVFWPSRAYYFDAVMLLFYMRVSLFRFSKELSDILVGKESLDTKKCQDALTELRKLFTRFTVLYRYPIVSNQQQMLELYEQQYESFDIEKLFREIQVEIDSTHEFLELLKANRLADDANRIAEYGLPLAVAAVLATLFAMVDLDLIDGVAASWENYTPDWDRIVQGILVVGAAFAVRCFFRKKKKTHSSGQTENKGAKQ